MGSEPCLSFSSFCTEFVAGLVKWLELSEAVLPTMTAFASGLGGEGADMFAQILLKDPILKDNPLVIIQVHPPPRGHLRGEVEAYFLSNSVGNHFLGAGWLKDKIFNVIISNYHY